MPPNRKQLFAIRLMILIGICCIFFFAKNLLNTAERGNRLLYCLLMLTFAFTIAKVLYEWYHYWHIKIDHTPVPKKAFTVDIFTTFCAGEPYEMIIETLNAIQAITYPHQTYLCDEADDPYLKNVCRELGVHHVTRVEKKDAKAGNINNALKQSTGDLCVILDPDHVPFPHFLDPIIGHFNDPQVGYVQIIQAYANQDDGWIAKGAAQQTYQYYGPMMMTMNAYGTVQAIGANCTFRRTALESIGGHAAGLAEDMHTSMQLHARGWKSVYVPAILSRGLVPSTLSAYYKQQLKWSRGVFELFVTSYIKLFRQYSWRQKLHYGLVPMFYLSGFIYLLNFVIPIASLFSDVYPLQMDFSAFVLISFPFITSVIFIRHYAQRWVMDDQERGFHIIGGLLLIGTWWVFITGFFYTLIRKKVPYIPTPKDATEERNLSINLPNIIVLLLSLLAIGYGLFNDWNPFTFTMAGICSVNCFFMVFILMASHQNKARAYQRQHQKIFTINNNIAVFKRRFWLWRRKMYSGMRSASLMLIVLSICIAAYTRNRPYTPEAVHIFPNYKNLLLTGIFYPSKADDGTTDIAKVSALQQDQKVHFDIISTYLSWGDRPQNLISPAFIDSVYRNRSIPMITWEPWQNHFKSAAGQKDERVFAHILSGKYDKYISQMAEQLRALNRPVFLRFAHEVDNPFYPWSPTGGNTAEDFKAAWRYVHDLFLAHGAWNVIWVWNPWKPETAAAYYPGRPYVDWIGVTGLNYGRYGIDGKSYSFKQLYTPFHRLENYWHGLPVMIAEMGSARDGHGQTIWLQSGIKTIKQDFHEVKAVVLFNSAFDKNAPDKKVGMINWQQDSLSSIHLMAANNNNLPAWPAASSYPYIHNSTKSFPTNIRGVIYLKGQNWYGNKYATTRKTIIADFKAMRKAGINTVKIYGPGVYDHITLQTARETGMNVNYSFWMPDPSVFASDNKYLIKLAHQVISTVAELKDNPQIKYWNIGNSPLQQMRSIYLQPELFYRKQAYITWLKKLVQAIKTTDPSRMVTVDVRVASNMQNTVVSLHDQIPEIDAFGLVLKENLKDTVQISKLSVPYYFSSVTPQLYFKLAKKPVSALMENWQDEQSASGIAFNGLKDIWGRNKPAFYEVTRHWTSDTFSHALPPIKILRPALTTLQGAVLPYSALVYKYGKWHLAQCLPTGLQFEWYQVQTDDWGTPLDIKLLANGAYLNYTVPTDPKHYRLYLIGKKGNDITTDYSILNIPLNDDAASAKN
ncbi:MAG: glycosyltransferase family 2 protein [Mucilaginibacter sp.]